MGAAFGRPRPQRVAASDKSHRRRRTPWGRKGQTAQGVPWRNAPARVPTGTRNKGPMLTKPEPHCLRELGRHAEKRRWLRAQIAAIGLGRATGSRSHFPCRSGRMQCFGAFARAADDAAAICPRAPNKVQARARSEPFCQRPAAFHTPAHRPPTFFHEVSHVRSRQPFT